MSVSTGVEGSPTCAHTERKKIAINHAPIAVNTVNRHTRVTPTGWTLSTASPKVTFVSEDKNFKRQPEKKFFRTRLEGDCVLRTKLPAGSVQTRNSLITSCKLTAQVPICRKNSGLTRLTMRENAVTASAQPALTTAKTPPDSSTSAQEPRR